MNQNILDYDDVISGSITKVTSLLEKLPSQNEADQVNTIEFLKTILKDARNSMVYFKRELLVLPKAQALEFKGKDAEYEENLGYLDFEVRKQEARIRGDEVAVLQMEHTGYQSQKQKFKSN